MEINWSTTRRTRARCKTSISKMTKEELTTIDMTSTDYLIFAIAIGLLSYAVYKSFTDDY